MTDAAWATLSDQAVAAAGVVYFLALIAHLVEWSSLRTPERSRAATAPASAAGAGSVAVETAPPPAEPVSSERAEFAGRLGVLLTVIAAVAHFTALLGRGMAADPNRVPWGNMYEFTLTGTFFVAAFYLV